MGTAGSTESDSGCDRETCAADAGKTSSGFTADGSSEG